jgi:pimeloyl-ACP methyl ester carboxylesterase
MPASKFVDVNKLRLHYLDYGSEGKPPLVCVHGLSGNAHNFDLVGARFADRYHVISMDVRGRGDSQWGPENEYDIPTYADDLAGLLDAAGFARASLIGTSMGGMISMMFGGRYPERVERLVLNDIGPQVDMRGGSRISAYFTQAPQEFADLAQVVAYYREHYPPMRGLADDAARESVKWSVKPTAHGTLTWRLDPAVRRMRAVTKRPDLWPSYRKIASPILIVRGADSDILAAAVATEMCQPPNHASIVEIPGVGHAPSLSEPEAVRALEAFLAP